MSEVHGHAAAHHPRSSNQVNYQQIGPYDEINFLNAFNARFKHSSRYNASATPNLVRLLRFIGQDPAITDVRWAAYMLATVMWETTYPTLIIVTVKNKKGLPVLDKHGKPITLKQRPWLMTMAPVEEIGHGRGRRYHDPVKVKVLGDGTAQITEQDGDVFNLSAGGAIKPTHKGAKMGSPSGAVASKTYEHADGVENAFFGRGYVQLTWWSNYLRAGLALNLGMKLLLDPDLVEDPDVAYQIMSYGMRTGKIFANGYSFSDFFAGKSRDYKGARKMVNGSDHDSDIAALAIAIESILLDARPTAGSTPTH